MKPLVVPGRSVIIVTVMALIISCARLPVIEPVGPAAMPDTRERCHRPFLDSSYRFIHAIEVSFPGGRRERSWALPLSIRQIKLSTV